VAAVSGLGVIVLTGGLAGLGTSASPSALLRTGPVEPLGAAAAGGAAVILPWTLSSRPFLS